MTKERTREQIERDRKNSGFGMLKFNKDPVKSTRELLQDNGDSTYNDIHIDNLVPNKQNDYPLVDIEALADSIRQFGLQQPLIVKPLEGGKYEIFAGHRRHAAILQILKNDTNKDYVYLETQTCVVLSPGESDVISHLKKHITNTEVRSLLQMSEEEKHIVVEDYMHWLDIARKEKIMINDEPIRGKTRDLVAERFGIAKSTAGEIISKIKNKGAEIGTPQKAPISSDEKAFRIEKQLSKNYNILAEIREDLEQERVDSLLTWLSDLEALLK